MTDLATSPAPLPSARLLDHEIGVVGIGTMGSAIAACLLVAGHRVRAIEPVAANGAAASARVRAHLDELFSRPPLDATILPPLELLERFTLSANYSDLADCALVIETVLEDMPTKHAVIARIEAQVAPTAIIGTNTSALPITQVQAGAAHPQRVLGMHFGLPPLGQFLEIIKGDATTEEPFLLAEQYARGWDRDPIMVRRDVRGCVANRIGYAMFREAMHLVESGVATPADVDRAIRYAFGSWAAFEGTFGSKQKALPLALTVARDLMPDLSNAAEPAAFLVEAARSGQKLVPEESGLDLTAKRRHLHSVIERATRELAALEKPMPSTEPPANS